MSVFSTALWPPVLCSWTFKDVVLGLKKQFSLFFKPLDFIIDGEINNENDDYSTHSVMVRRRVPK